MKHTIRLRLTIFLLFTSVLMSSLTSQAQLRLKGAFPKLGSRSMDVFWTNSFGATETEVRRSVNGGPWEPWFSIGDTDKFTDMGLSEGNVYSYQIREKIFEFWSEPSNIKSNSFQRVWPVLKPGGNGAESVEILTAFQEAIRAEGTEYFHDGLDMNGESGSSNEEVRAPIGGIVLKRGGGGTNVGVNLEVSINGVTRYIQFNHLEDLDPKVVLNETVEAGQVLGKIISPGAWSTLSSHTHCHFWGNLADMHGSTLNPFDIWTTPAYRDPYGIPPLMMDVNGDKKDIRYRRTPEILTYFGDDNKVHNGVEIIVEAVDKQSADEPWQPPAFVGYYIQRKEKGAWVQAVKTSADPYTVFNNQYFYHSDENHPNNFVTHKIMHYDPDVQAKDPVRPPGYDWGQWFTYQVTNTKGELGKPEDIDGEQRWATDARNTVGEANGYTAGYDLARIIDEAKFPDATYRVGVVLKDLIQRSGDSYRELKVDNFRPYAKIVQIEGGPFKYKATWDWNPDANQLTLQEDKNDKKACGTIRIRITMSEAMKDVTVGVPSLSFAEHGAKEVGGSYGLVWEIEIPEELTKEGPEGPHKLEINGHDLNDNALQGFTDKGAKSGNEMHKRILDGTWVPAGAPAGKDVIHEFKLIDLEIDVETTPPSSCGKKDATATINVAGDPGPFTYSVDGSNFQSSNTFKNLGSGSHTVVVRKNETECEFFKEFAIEKSPSDIKLTVSGYGTLEICEDQDASITLTADASGGSGDFDYNWPGGSLTVHGSGRYTAVVTDKVTGCKKDLGGDVSIVRIVCSRDPNDIIGPEGYGPGKMIAKSKNHAYMVRFENDPNFATAPAQVVKINHPLDSNTNLYSLRLGDFGFAGMTFPVPADKTFYTTRLNVMDSLGVVVDVTAGIDVTKKEVFWVFESKDPATGLPPANALLGFLPINDSSGRGEGFVTYTIKAANHTNTGDSIRAKASIVFDLNAPIETPVVFNTIDALPPVSRVKALPATSKATDFRVSWSGQDDAGGSGVRDYVLYVSENGGTFKAVQAATIDTAITFSGTSGSTYSFFTLSSDNTGNLEGTKYAGEATIKIEDACPAEICNGVDDDCDGEIDEGFTKYTYYRDADGDGYGSTTTITVCETTAPAGYTTVQGDCNDNDNTVNPGVTEICDNNKDDNCNGQVDENCGITRRYYPDIDRDGYGREQGSRLSDKPIPGWVLIGGDCADWDATVNPGAAEAANGRDDNCNGQVDEGLPMLRYYMDVDRDGYGRDDNSKLSAIPLAGHVLVNGDCKDWDATVYPGAAEGANGRDDNCNGQVDEGLPMLRYYMDVDRDGYGRNDNSKLSAIPLAGHVLINGDCKDWDATVYPGAPEQANGFDDNCNGQVDEGLPMLRYYMDVDGDGYGRNENSKLSAIPLAGHVLVGGDCKDWDATVNPGAAEVKNGRDDNCNGQVDEQLITSTQGARESAGKQAPESSIAAAGEFQVVVSPVPSYHTFTVHLQQGEPLEKIRIRVYDQVGRLVEVKDNLVIGARITLGGNYAKGHYTLEAVQGRSRKLIKLIKL